MFIYMTKISWALGIGISIMNKNFFMVCATFISILTEAKHIYRLVFWWFKTGPHSLEEIINLIIKKHMSVETSVSA